MWTEPLNELAIHEWAALIKTPSWQDINGSARKMNSIGVYDTIQNDFEAKLHNQTGFLIDYCTAEKILDWREKNVPIPERWVEIFKHFHATHCGYDELSVIAEYILCLPGTNCSVERLFSATNLTWTSSKTNLLVATLRAILTVKCNFRQSCIEFYDYLLKTPELLKRISSKDKYKIENSSDDIEMLTDTSGDEEE